jgi:hypothetical protein
VIQPNADAYGTYAQASAVADYLELVAWIHGSSKPRASVGDMISDSGWRIKVAENFHVPDSEEEEEETSDAEERVFNILGERARVLGDKYPFRQDASGRVVPAEIDAGDPYLALLALTAAHAYSIATPQAPETVFEQTVADILAARGWLAVNFRRLRTGPGDFVASLNACGPQIGIETDAEGAVYNLRAFDEGVDALAHIPWCTVRRGRWTVIGQATCAVSNEWKAKLEDASEWTWAGLLGEKIAPLVFLAVPHHAEPKHRLYLIDRSRKAVFDRLSLVAAKSQTSEAERAISIAVRAEGVERL